MCNLSTTQVGMHWELVYCMNIPNTETLIVLLFLAFFRHFLQQLL